MVQKYLSQQRHDGTVGAIAERKFPFPNDENPDLDTLLNIPKRTISVGKSATGEDLFPDIVVVRRPGQWLTMMAEVEMTDTLTDEQALTRWAPMSLLGDLYVYVPMGQLHEAKKLAKKHGVRIAGFRTWRFRPVWGVDVTEA